MKLIPILFTAILLGVVAPLNVQNVDEIIANYLNNIGGEENLKKLPLLSLSEVSIWAE